MAIAAATEVAAGDTGVATRITLLPIGSVILRDGRGPFLVADRAHAEQIIAATRTYLGPIDLMIDYDHQALYAPKPGVGGTAKAAGWIKVDSLVADDAGIHGEVSWTAAAAASLAAREYRYISPTFMADAASKRVAHLKNAALVNIPAIDLAAVAAGDTPGETMSLTAIAAALALDATADEPAIIAAITTLQTPVLAPIAAAAGLPDTATAEQIAAAVTSKMAPDPAKFVPIEQVSAITAQLGTLNAERAEREVAAAVTCGKLAPALKAWGIDLFKADEGKWAAWLAGAPVIIAAGLADAKDQPAKTATGLSAEEIAAAVSCGMTEAEFLAAKQLEIA